MKQRVLTGISLAGLAMGLLLYGSSAILTTVALVAATIGYVEFDRLFFQVESKFRRFRIVVLICITVLAIRENLQYGWLTIWGSFVVFCVSQLYTWKDEKSFERAVRAISLEWLGYFYSVSIFGFLVPLIELPYGRSYILLLFFIVFGGDTAAYFVGSRFGKHKLAPTLSPKKSVEGSIAALLSAVLVTLGWLAIVGRQMAYNDNHIWALFGIALILSVLAQVGDLFESLLKRSQYQKDSGSFLPGHGGILDRIDGLSLSAPVFYAFVRWGLEA